MSEFFAEATVRLQPDLTGFITQLRVDLKTAIERVENGARPPSIRVRPALTKNFIGDLRKQANTAIAQAERGLRPLRVQATVQPLTRRQLADFQGAVRGPRAVRASDPARGIEAATTANDAFAASQQRVDSLLARGGVILGQNTAEQKVNTQERLRGARAGLQVVQSKDRESEATRLLNRLENQLNATRAESLGTRAATRGIARAEAQLTSLQAIATEQLTVAERRRLEALRQQVVRLATANEALRQHQRELARTARAQEQLRRGALSTGLSFLGIRGATLAASASFLAGAASIAVFARALQTASAFTDQINVFRATAGATAAELEQVRQAARALGADITLPGVSSADAAESMVELAKAGLDVQDSIDGARGVLQLATAAAIENAQAVELTANALNAFQLQGRDATRVADVFANAANAAQGSIVDIGIAFQQAAAAGRQVGLSFEDTATFLTILARNGLRGSDAGTSLRTALIRLIRPTKEARERLAELGVELRDAQGNLRPDVFQQLSAAVADLAPAARDAVIALVGGQDAFRAISILGRQSIEEFIRLRRELREQGTAAELAAARTEGLRGSVDALGSTLETTGVQIGRGVTPSIQGLVDSITSAVAAMSESEEVARTFGGGLEFIEVTASALGATLAAVGPPLLVVASGFEAAASAVGVPTLLAAVAAYRLLPAVLTRSGTAFRALQASTLVASASLLTAVRSTADLRAALSLMAGVFNPVALGIAAVAAGLIFLHTQETAAERATKQLAEATTELSNALSAARDAQRRAGETRLSTNAAELAVLEAQQAAATVRSALATSQAARGSFARKKLELELAVAIDNVRAAQQRHNQILQDAIETQDEARQAARNAELANESLSTSLSALVAAERRTILGRDPETSATARHQEAQAIGRVTEALRDQAQAARQENSAQSRSLARRLELLALVSTALGEFPTQRAIDIVVNTQDASTALRRLQDEFGVTSRQLSQELFSTLTSGRASAEAIANITDLMRRLGISATPGARDSGRQIGRGLGTGIAEGVDDTGPQVEAAVANVVARATGRLQGLERQALTLDIQGAGPTQVLANLRQQEAEARTVLAEQQRLFALGKVAEESVRRAQEDLARIINDIRAVESQMAQDAQQAADQAQRDRDQRDQALLDLLGVNRDRARERIQGAQLTESVRDDIARTRELRQLVLRQIAIVQDRIKNAKLRIAAVRELRAISRDLARELRQLQQQRQQEIQDRVAESNQLDIELAQTNENRNAEIRARQREIARLKRLQALTKQGSLEYKRLRNAIAEQRAAIKDLRDEAKETNNEFARLFFQSLQRQQGFAANLLGNLIPGGSTLGLVGNAAPLVGRPIPSSRRGQQQFPGAESFGGGLGEALIRNAALSQAGGAGPTRGQATVEIDVLRQILDELRLIRQGRSHPEARQAKATGAAAMDVM